MRPWDTGDKVGDPEDTTAIDKMDAAQVLEGWWRAPGEDELADMRTLREMFAPFDARFPRLAPAVEEELDPELMRRAVFQYTRDARIGLVPVARPVDIREDRFGARLLELDFQLLVSRPPQTLEAAQPIAAEHVAF